MLLRVKDKIQMHNKVVNQLKEVRIHKHRFSKWHNRLYNN